MHIYFFPVKEKPQWIGGSLKFNITKNFLRVCNQAHIKNYIALKEKREAEQEDERKRVEKINLEKNRRLAQWLEEIDRGKSDIHSGNSKSSFDTSPDTFSEQTIFFLTN